MVNALLALPLYYGLVFIPHAYSMALISATDMKAYNNANPRGREGRESVRKALGPERWARFERARAAHDNGLENFPLFAAAMLAGSVARVPGVAAAAAVNLAARALYNVVYIGITSRRTSYLRTLIFTVMTVANLTILTRAGFAGLLEAM